MIHQTDGLLRRSNLTEVTTTAQYILPYLQIIFCTRSRYWEPRILRVESARLVDAEEKQGALLDSESHAPFEKDDKKQIIHPKTKRHARLAVAGARALLKTKKSSTPHVPFSTPENTCVHHAAEKNQNQFRTRYQ